LIEDYEHGGEPDRTSPSQAESDKRKAYDTAWWLSHKHEGLRWPARAVFSSERLVDAFEQHRTSAWNWSSRIQFYSMPAPEPLDAVTLNLDLTSVPRRLRPSAGPRFVASPALHEDVLISERLNFVVLGDPGAGKTTTLKRLVASLLDPARKEQTRPTPVVAVLREHAGTNSIARVVLEQLGLSAEASAFLHPDGLRDSPRNDLDDLEHQLAASVLDSFNAVLFLDGLDEVDPRIRSNVDLSIVRLARLMSGSKIIVTCRSGDYSGHLDTFGVVEIVPLSVVDIERIADLWLGKSSKDFISAIADSPAGQLADRPLFLTHLLTLYRLSESLPDRPSTVLRQMTRLSLQDWDRQRGVIRSSRYAAFDADAKLEFLTNVAYLFTFQLRRTSVSHDSLMMLIESIARRFDLPPSEFERMAYEIETHTGIIVEESLDRYAFSHESLQEYLAAEFLVRMPATPAIHETITVSPAVAAVAVALSSDSTRFLSTLLESDLEVDSATWNRFIRRLLLERPRFSAGSELGRSMATLLGKFDNLEEELPQALLGYRNVAFSLVLALRSPPSAVESRRDEVRRLYLLEKAKDSLGLSETDLRGAELRGTDLRGMDLSGADLRGIDLSGVDLSGADLRGARADSLIFDRDTQRPAE
jgi:hypothetical protein